MKNKELRVKSASMLFFEKLLLKRSTAQQCKPQLFTLNRRKEVK